MYHFQPYLTLNNHGFFGYAVVVNKDFSDTLPAGIQEQIEEAIKETTLWNMDTYSKMNEGRCKE